MSFADERRAIETLLSDNFNDLPIKFESIPFDQPNDAGWVALTILGGEGNQIALGNSDLQRYSGVIQLDIYLPADTGTQVARTHADTLEVIFRHKQFSSGNSGTITTRTPWYATRGVESEWYHAVVTVSYMRDRTF